MDGLIVTAIAAVIICLVVYPICRLLSPKCPKCNKKMVIDGEAEAENYKKNHTLKRVWTCPKCGHQKRK